jgi:hypothetical protein
MNDTSSWNMEPAKNLTVLYNFLFVALLFSKLVNSHIVLTETGHYKYDKNDKLCDPFSFFSKICLFNLFYSDPKFA